MSTVVDQDAEPKPTSSDPSEWLRVPAAAKRFGLTHPRTLYRLARERKVPFRRLPGTSIIAFAPEDLEEIAKLSEVRPLRATA